MCKSFIQSDIDNLCEEIKNRTNINDHTGARILAANYFHQFKAAKLFEHIEAINKIEGHLPSQLIEYRQMVYDQMMINIKIIAGDTRYQRLRRAF